MMINTLFFSNLNPSDPREEPIGEVSIAYISPQERKRRVRFAVRQLIFTLVVLGGLVLPDVNPLWRLLLFFMFSAATTSCVQALDKTSVSLASRGLRNISDKEEHIEDQVGLKPVRRQAFRVILKGVFAAIPLTALAYLIP